MTARWKTLEKRVARAEAAQPADADDVSQVLAALTRSELVELEDLIADPPGLLCSHCGRTECAVPRRRPERSMPRTDAEEERLAAIVAVGRSRLARGDAADA